MKIDVRRARHVARARVAAVVALGVVFAAVAACGGEPSPAATPTPEPSATTAPIVVTTETPTPEPTPVPTVRAATPALAAATGKLYFPPPPPRQGAPPANNSGIARIFAPTLGVDHYVEVDNIINNELESPRDGSYAVGWYHDFDKPGAGGNSVFSAHETWNHFQGPFYQLVDAKNGDEISVIMSDGKQYRYRVFSNVRYTVDEMPMAEILWPTKRPAGEEWLTLFTCGGRIVYDSSGFGEYLDRDVVIAKRIQ